MSKLILVIIVGFVFSTLMLSLIAFPVSAQKNGPPGEVISVFGKIPGKDLVVHAWVVVPPGADKNEAAKNALQQQGARPWAHEKFETTGLFWDQFDDGNTATDFVKQYYNPKNQPTEVDESVLLSTHDTWNSVSSSNFAFSYGGTTNRCPSLVQECPGPQRFDTNNDVGWRSLGGCCTLGVAWYGLSTDEVDIALNTKFSWFIDGTTYYDVETVLLHENGHALGLGHYDIKQAVMNSYYEEVRRSLYQDDIDGITFLYPLGVPNNSPSVIIDSPSNSDTFASGATINFAGTASDTEDEDSTLSIVWSSDLDGSIGMGESFSTTLSDGSHTITAEVTDSGGKTGSDSITITVGNSDDEGGGNKGCPPAKKDKGKC